MSIYINPYTDFGFKRLFGEEARKGLLIDFLAKVANFNQKQLDAYEQSLKEFRDYHNVVDSAVNKKTKETIIRNLKRGKMSLEEIAEDNDVALELVLKIQAQMKP